MAGARTQAALALGAALAGGVATLLAGPLARRAHAQDTPPPPAPRATARARPADELPPATLEAVERGAAWLAREQVGSGRWASNPSRYQMSITGLAGLALLAHGDTPDAGRYRDNVRRAVRWVLDSQRKDGPHAGLLFDLSEAEEVQDDRPMHGHGFALLFLAEAYGETRDAALRERMREAIARACRLTERSISADGGWYYHPASGRDEGSVTITQIQALRSAHNAGIWVDPRVVRRAVDYIKASQQPDGGVRYTLRWGRTSAALTAAGLSVLHGAGEYHGDAVEKGLAYLRIHNEFDRSKVPFWYYTHLYTAQAMFQRGGADWEGYFPRIQRELLEHRNGTDHWDSPFGKSYGTAIALLILQLPRRYLPIFQR